VTVCFTVGALLWNEFRIPRANNPLSRAVRWKNSSRRAQALAARDPAQAAAHGRAAAGGLSYRLRVRALALLLQESSGKDGKRQLFALDTLRRK
jgi:hypothetical protein